MSPVSSSVLFQELRSRLKEETSKVVLVIGQCYKVAGELKAVWINHMQSDDTK